MIEFKPGMIVKVITDNADGARVVVGDVGIVVEHPMDSVGFRDLRNQGFIAVSFNLGKNVGGAYGDSIAVFKPSNITPCWTDEELFEDSI